MAEESLYEGREHSWIKHQFLAEYLKTASFKVLQGRSDTLTYVDGFAGPWAVSDESNFSDASFDHAVRVLQATRDYFSAAGRRPPVIRYLLCEKDPAAFERLSAYARKKDHLEIRVFKGLFEDNLSAIRAACAGFVITFIDPRGWNLRSAEIADFLASTKGDFLFNFMEHPIARHNAYEAVKESFGRFLGDPDWRGRIDSSPGAPPRELQILAMLKDCLKSRRAATYTPDFAIMKAKADRVQMRLLLGTHHPQGVEVFRTVQKSVQTLQNTTRRTLASGGSEPPSLFREDELADLELEGTGVGGHKSKRDAAICCEELLDGLSAPLRFEELAARVMERVPVRMTDLKGIVVSLRASGRLTFTLEGRAKKPSEATLIRTTLR